LSDIASRNYHGILSLKAERFIDLGLAVYSAGTAVKAAFRQEGS
jgi:hypothetical protein